MNLLLLSLLLLPISFIVRAICLNKLWQWFIVPLGMPEISVAHTIGILSIIFMLLAGLYRQPNKVNSETDIIGEVMSSVVVYLLITVIAGIVKFIFMG